MILVKYVEKQTLNLLKIVTSSGSSGSQSYMSLSSKKQEISADRFGLYVCGDVKKSLSALLKTASGLNDDHLVFDISKFISQYEFNDDENLQYCTESSHPSMIVRARALLWFSTSETYFNLPELYNNNTLENIEKRIMLDLHSDFDGEIGIEISSLKEAYVLWSIVLVVYNSGSFSKNAQSILGSHLGEENLGKVITYFNHIDESEIKNDLEHRISIVSGDLKEHLQNSYELQHKKLLNAIKAIEKKLFESDFEDVS